MYLDETKLIAVKKALEQIASEVEGFLKERESATCSYLGAEEFWRPYQRIHTLNAAYYIVPDSTGLSLSAYKCQEFRFPGHNPSELAEALGRAMDELKQRISQFR
ncbi:MAG TPA: hypothetical protein VNO70_17940 [Blastocatellia bacterium]|nr:hypothetical protein [Blastocatellia bacterium]